MNADAGTTPDPIDITEELAQEVMRQLDLLNGSKVQEDISYGQYKIISVINSQGPISVGQLGAYVGLAQSTTSEMVARLRKTGIVTKVKGPYDGRVVMVELTEQGRSLMHRRKHRVRQSYQNFFSRIPLEEQQMFTESLKKLDDILKKTWKQ
jgi:DNA-binding MarR family transcriptional regulator